MICLLVLTVCILLLSVGCIGDKPTDVVSVKSTSTQVELTMTSIPTEMGAAVDGSISPLIVPAGDPPSIDGIHSPGEWDDALLKTFADGSQLLYLRSGDFLYLGIIGKDAEMFSNNVYINQGDEVTILHSSAALGTAIYHKIDNIWNQTQDFTWRCRKTDQSEAAQAERTEFLQAEGWLASNGRMGTPNEMEYMITMPDQDFRMAVTIIKSSPSYEKIPWPANLKDDCIRETPGGLPDIMEFTPNEWGAIDLE